MYRNGSIKLTLVVVLGVIAVLGIGGCNVILGTLNSEVNQRNVIVAKSNANEATLDTMWKIIKQKANITEQAVSDIKDMNGVYEDLVQGRSGGALFKMVTENYPNLAQKEVSAMYLDLMSSVEAERKTFKRDQQIIQDMVGTRNSLLDRPVSKFVLNIFGDDKSTTRFMKRGDENTPDEYPLDFQYVWVTSKATKQMIDDGEENEVELFER